MEKDKAGKEHRQYLTVEWVVQSSCVLRLSWNSLRADTGVREGVGREATWRWDIACVYGAQASDLRACTTAMSSLRAKYTTVTWPETPRRRGGDSGARVL